MATTPQTVQVKVVLDAEAFQDAVQDAIDRAAQEARARVTPTEHVRPEDVREGDVLMVRVRVVSVRPPDVNGPKDRPHIRTVPETGPWSVDRAGRIWTHGWSLGQGAALERLVRR